MSFKVIPRFICRKSCPPTASACPQLSLQIRARTMSLTSAGFQHDTHLKSPRKRKPKRFAPLDSSVSNKHNAPKLRGIVFDVDGTLWYTSPLPMPHLYARFVLTIESTACHRITCSARCVQPWIYQSQRISWSTSKASPTRQTTNQIPILAAPTRPTPNSHHHPVPER
jgi:hypothetical protein